MRVDAAFLKEVARTRRCAVSGRDLPLAELVRFVRAPDGQLTPDLAARLPGRGVWVSADRATVEDAIKSGAFARGLKAQTTVPEGMCGGIAKLLRKRCLSLLGLARRSGQLVVGGQRCAQRLEHKDRPACLVIAEDACPKTNRSLTSSWRRRFGNEPVVIAAFGKEELSEALGRWNVAYGLLPRCGLAHKFISDAARMAGFETTADRGVV